MLEEVTKIDRFLYKQRTVLWRLRVFSDSVTLK